MRSARPRPLPSAPRAAPAMDPSGIIEALRGTMDPALREAAERQLNEVRAPPGLGRGRGAGERGRGRPGAEGAGRGRRGSPRLPGPSPRGRGPFPPAAQAGPGAHCPRTWQRGRAGRAGLLGRGQRQRAAQAPCLSRRQQIAPIVSALGRENGDLPRGFHTALVQARGGHSPAWDRPGDSGLWGLEAPVCPRERGAGAPSDRKERSRESGLG